MNSNETDTTKTDTEKADITETDFINAEATKTDITEVDTVKIEEMVVQAVTKVVKVEPPFAFARKLAGWLCMGIWVFGIVSLIAGVDVTIVLPYMFLALGIVCGLYIPVFFARKKVSDVVISILATIILIAVAIGLRFFGA